MKERDETQTRRRTIIMCESCPVRQVGWTFIELRRSKAGGQVTKGHIFRESEQRKRKTKRKKRTKELATVSKERSHLI